MSLVQKRPGLRGALALVVAISFTLLVRSPGADAHPLGNFSVNHAHALTFTATGVVDHAVVDFAEIPTEQASSRVDADGNADISDGELSAYGQALCEEVRAASTLTTDSATTMLRLTAASFHYQPGQAGLQTSRLECVLQGSADLVGRHRVLFRDAFSADRVGWREITAIGEGVGLLDSPVPAASTTGSLRTYPLGLLESPLNVRSVELVVDSSVGAATVTVPVRSKSPSFLSGGPFATMIDGVSRRFDGLVGQRDLTVGVGSLAMALALLLGASHALLPGHGKTVMAAYIAGRQGSAADAVVVGATVTATHTAGVLVLGLALSVSTSLAGPVVLAWLGVASGLLIAGLGFSLLINTLRRRHGRQDLHGHAHAHGDHGHAHGHGHGDHGHEHHDHVGRVEGARRVSRQGLVGMGIAGGLVPSPSALIVLLSSIALGRTAFGVLLVVGYGLGMAATLTIAGLLLVGIRDRHARRRNAGSGRTTWLADRWIASAPFITAALVLLVGFGLAVRSAGSL